MLDEHKKLRAEATDTFDFVYLAAAIPQNQEAAPLRSAAAFRDVLQPVADIHRNTDCSCSSSGWTFS